MSMEFHPPGAPDMSMGMLGITVEDDESAVVAGSILESDGVTPILLSDGVTPLSESS